MIKRSFAWSVLAPALAFFALLAGLIGTLIALQWSRDIEARARDNLSNAMNYVQQEIKSRERNALAFANLLADNRDVSEALKNRDREGLSKLIQQRYEDAKAKHGVRQLQFHLPPATSFLRMHDPAKFGDDLSAFRKTVVQVNATLTPISGIEVGRDGIGLRGVTPVRANGVHIGSVEFGLNLEAAFLKEMKERYQVDWQLVLKREYAGLTSLAKKMDATAQWVPITSTLPAFVGLPESDLGAIAGQNVSAFSSASSADAGNSETQPFLVYSQVLQDFSGAQIGVLQALVDLTPQIRKRNQAIATALGLLLASLAIGAMALTWIVNRQTQPLARVAAVARTIADGNLTALEDLNKVQHRNAETQGLTDSVRSMTGQLIDSIQGLEARVAEKTADVSRLNGQLQVENRRLGAELDIQRRLQQMLLPSAKELNAVPGLNIAAHMMPANEISGDYYDVFGNGDQTTIAIGDVTGHGLESGVVMLMTQSILRGLLAQDGVPTQGTLQLINHALRQNLARSGLDKSLSFCLLDYRRESAGRGTLKLTGQHESVIVARQSGKTENFDTDTLGFPMGLIDDIGEFTGQLTLHLTEGDVVVLYTDGLTEAENPQGELYGVTRVCALVEAQRSKSAEQIKDALISDMTAFSRGQAVLDDVTVLVLKQIST